MIHSILKTKIALFKAKMANFIAQVLPKRSSNKFNTLLENEGSIERFLINISNLHLKISIIERALKNNKELATETLNALNKKQTNNSRSLSNQLSLLHEHNAIYQETLKGLYAEREKLVRWVEQNYLNSVKRN